MQKPKIYISIPTDVTIYVCTYVILYIYIYIVYIYIFTLYLIYSDTFNRLWVNYVFIWVAFHIFIVYTSVFSVPLLILYMVISMQHYLRDNTIRALLCFIMNIW